MDNAKVNLKQLLNDKGFRFTEQRRIILDIFSKNKGERFTCEEIYNLAKRRYPDMGIATAFRALPFLEKVGLLNRIVLGDGFIRYELNTQEE